MNIFDFIKYWMDQSYSFQYLTDEQILDFLQRNNIDSNQDSEGWIVLYKPNLETKEFIIKLISPDFSIKIIETLSILVDTSGIKQEVISLL